jgi:hypothetical protein
MSPPFTSQTRFLMTVSAPRTAPDTAVGRYTWNLRTGHWTWDQGIYVLYGLPETVPPSKETFQAHKHPDDREHTVEVIEQALATGQSFACEHRIIRTDGTVRHVVATGEVLTDERGGPQVLRGRMVDVSDRYKLEQQSILATVDGLPSPTADIDAATAIHALALPATLHSLPDVQVAARYLPERGPIGGDFYDAWIHQNGPVTFVVADVTGHGVQAAAAMSRLSVMLRAFGEDAASPAHVLHEVNRLNCAAGAALATALIMTIDTAAATARWATAGHCAPLLVRAGDVSELEGPVNLLLGVDPDTPYSETELALEPGDRLMMFTDGLIERHRRTVDAGVHQLIEAAHRPGPDLDNYADDLLKAMNAEEREDDVCLLLAEFMPPRQDAALHLANPYRKRV